jgi:aminopeptidase N
MFNQDLIFTDKTYEENISMTLANAKFRAATVSNVEYAVDLAMPKGDVFFGKVTTTFDLAALPTKKLYLDFRGLRIAHLKINGAQVKNTEGDDQSIYTGHQVNLANESLKQGSNSVEMFFWNKYRNDSVGLHSFIDPIDSEQYLYTQFEPSHAHYVFPCFD